MYSTRLFPSRSWTIRLLLLAFGLLILVVGPVHAALLAPAAMVKLAAPNNKITIDGKGNESAWVRNTAVNSLTGANGVVATFKLAYDVGNFYALVTVTDNTPLKANAAVDLQHLFKYDDALGFCFGPYQGQSNNQRIFLTRINGQPRALVMRPNWPDKSHQYTYTMNTAVTLDDVHELVTSADYQAAFTSTADGYTLELRLPWRTLGYTPADEQEFPFDLQLVGSSNGAVNDAVAWWHSLGPEPFTLTDLPTEAALYPQYWGYVHLYVSDPGPQPTPPLPGDDENVFTNPGPGSVPIRFSVPANKPYASLVIKDANGWIVRELLRAQKLTPNVTQTVYWDGRDRTGQPCPAGNYTYLLGTFKGLTVSFAGSVGNSGHPVYPQADGSGSIGGVHGGPWTVAADSTGVYLLSAISEGQLADRKYNPATGATFWWANYGHYPQAVTTCGNELFLIYNDTGADAVRLVRLNRDTGVTAADPVKLCTQSLGIMNVDGLAVINDIAYYTDPVQNRIMQLDMRTQHHVPAPLVTFTSAPHGLAAYDATSLLACVGSKVVKVATDGTQTDFITGLVAPFAVAVDTARGFVYVSDLGSVQQIRQYTLTGAQQAVWGVAGGRPLEMSPADPLRLLNVKGLAVDPNTGDVWAAERQTDLRRFIRFHHDGAIAETINGPTTWSTSVIVDRDDVSNVYYHTILNNYVQAHVNFARYAADFQQFPKSPAGWGTNAAWSIVNTWNPEANAVDPALLPPNPNLFFFLGQPINGKEYPFGGGSNSPGQVLTANNGKRYMLIVDNFLIVHAAILLWENNRWTPVATVGQGGASRTWADTVTPNGRVESNEFAATNPPIGGFVWLDPDLTLHGLAGTLKPASINARGVPIYEHGTYTPLLKAGEPSIQSYFEHVYDFIYPSQIDMDGAQYIVGQVGVGTGVGIWDRASELRVAKLKNGRVEWIIGHHNALMTHNGDSTVLGRPAGVVDGVFLCPEADHDCIAYTTDGLTLGWVARDGNDHQTMYGPNSILLENFNGFFLKDPVTGKRLLISSAGEDVRFLEIKDVFTPAGGVSDLTRTTGKLTLASALPRMPDEVPSQYTLRYRSWPLQFAQTYTVSGYDWDFAKDADALGIKDGAARVADVRLRRDAGQLCVFADVLDPTVFPDTPVNPAQNYEHGDGLEILLGPLGPTRTSPTAGDTRLFFTAKKDANGTLVGYAYACRPASPDISATYTTDMRALLYTGAFTGTAPAAPLNFRGGLVAIPNTVVTVKPRFDKAGYRLEAEIPLALFPELVGAGKTTVSISRSCARPSVFTDARWDLPESPLRFNAALFLGNGNGAARRLPWVADAQVAGDPCAMNPSRWGIANSKVTIDWPSIGGTFINGHTRYNLYRSAQRDPAAATWVRTVTDALQTVDAPGAGSFYYWLAPVYDSGEGQWLGPVATDANRLVHFWRRDPAKALPAKSFTCVYGYVGTTTMINVLVQVGVTPRCTSPAGMTITPRHWQPAQGGTIWSLALAMPAETPVGATAMAHLTADKVSRDVTIIAALAPLQNLELGSFNQAPWHLVITDDPAHRTTPFPQYPAYGVVDEEPGQPWPYICLRGGACSGQFPIKAIPEATVGQWTVSGNIKFNMQYCGGQPTQLQLLDDAGQPIATFSHDLHYIQGDLQQVLLLNGAVFYNRIGYSDALLSNWQPFTLTVADGQATLTYAGAYHATVPLATNWRRPRTLVIDVKNTSGASSHPDRRIMLNDLRLTIDGQSGAGKHEK